MLKNEYFILNKFPLVPISFFFLFGDLLLVTVRAFGIEIFVYKKRFDMLVAWLEVFREGKFYIALENRIVYYCNL